MVGLGIDAFAADVCPGSQARADPPGSGGRIAYRSIDMVAFTPQCLNCKYELVGLPSGRCPECGAYFTHAGLLAAHRERARVRRLIPPKWLLIFAWCPLLCVWHRDGVEGELWVQGLVLVAVAWFAIDEARLHRRAPVQPLVLLGLAFAARWGLLASGMLPGPLPVFAAAFITAGVMWRLRPEEPSPFQSIAPLALAVGTIVLGIAMIVDNAIDLQSGHYWSEWGALGGSAWTYPMSVSRAIWVGAATVAGGIALAAVGASFGWKRQ